MKANALWSTAGVLSLGVVASLLKSRASVNFVRLLSFTFAGVGLFAAVLQIFILLAPPYNEQGQAWMPLGQTALALLTSLILLPVLLTLYVKRLTPRPKIEAWFIRVLFIWFLGAALRTL